MMAMTLSELFGCHSKNKEFKMQSSDKSLKRLNFLARSYITKQPSQQ